MKPNPQLETFLAPYDPAIQNLAMELRGCIINWVPEANELIWDNYNALAIAYSKSDKLKDAFCHIALYSKHVNFGFNRGAELTKKPIKLNGAGKLIRHIKVIDFEYFPKKEVEKMVYEALALSEKINPELLNIVEPPSSLVMSISEKKIRPNSNS